MHEGAPDVQAEALEHIAFLSRSVNRVQILQALTNQAATRQELAEHTATSRTTLDRIVNEFEDRGWVERTVEGSYSTTSRGTHIVRTLQPFLESIVAIENLGEAVDWLPTEEVTIGLEHFSDAVVQRPSQPDPVETIDLMVQMVEKATEHRALTHLTPAVRYSEAILEGVESGRLTAEGVLTNDSIDLIRENPERRDRWASVAPTGTGHYHYDGELPCNLWIIDENVLIKKSGPEPFAEALWGPHRKPERDGSFVGEPPHRHLPRSIDGPGAGFLRGVDRFY
jgi:predicted transcriptional regulator